MKKIGLISLGMVIIAICNFSPALAGFDWGNGDGDCSGSGSFQQQIAYDDTVEVGDIPSGKEGVYIKLTSDEDVDIQLYDKNTGEKIVHWPNGILADYDKQTTSYHGVDIEWSGYNGDGTGLGHEYIKITGMTNRPFTMKAFGYKAGYATVDYSWSGTEGCGVPAVSGSGTFQQQIAYRDIVEVGELIEELSDVYIELICNEDVDIQLYDKHTGEKIVHWPDGILDGADRQNTNYFGVDIEWSGYNGDGTGLGHEYIRITGKTNRSFIMKAFGYQAGYATVNYSWGDNNVVKTVLINEAIVKFDGPPDNGVARIEISENNFLDLWYEACDYSDQIILEAKKLDYNILKSQINMAGEIRAHVWMYALLDGFPKVNDGKHSNPIDVELFTGNWIAPDWWTDVPWERINVPCILLYLYECIL